MKATKTKKTKIYPGNTRPPREIQEKTKERRAWLAQRLAELQRFPNLEAKVVGKGSYEEISVWEKTEVEGRLRFRGHCQYCGALQVVKDGVTMVLHGYKRPGVGYIFNECPGMNLPPLNKRKDKTEAWLADAKVTLATANEVYAKAEAAKKTAEDAFYSDEVSSDQRLDAHRARPKKPWRFERDATDADRETYRQALSVWREAYPLAAAVERTTTAFSAAQQSQWAAESLVRHFEQLLTGGYYGKPLTKEVVVE